MFYAFRQPEKGLISVYQDILSSSINLFGNLSLKNSRNFLGFFTCGVETNNFIFLPLFNSIFKRLYT